ncbi:MAG TPA: Uma2 family endonuclease [Hyphomicrobiaceae bacterium]|jgi:Uma2 family endonuclease|nr:Uma2 family endonuclease [Hyphomicrobiaceae bacterium]
MNTPFPVRTDGKFTVEEYLAFIASRPEEERWQLIDGVAMMMPPPTVRHQVIAANLAFELNTHFRQHQLNLRAVQETGLMVPDVASFRPEADVAVLDRTADVDTLYADRFYLVAEILSESNTDKDIAAKARRYIQHPQNLYFLLIDQKQVRVEVHARTTSWEPVAPEALDAVLELSEWGFRMPLPALYDGTPLATA